MDADLINGLVSSGVTLVVGAAGAIVAYYGTIKGAKIQIENEQKKLKEAEELQAIFTREAIENFLHHEIKSNYMLLNRPLLTSLLTENTTPFQYNVGDDYKSTYDEFNRLKYELIKFESDEVKEIISIYDMFYLIERMRDIDKFNQSEYDQFKKAYDICEAKYY
jgi:hypothetical protein